MKRQVSTRPEKITAFFEQIREIDAESMAIVECCGFNDWLIEELRKYECREIVLIHHPPHFAPPQSDVEISYQEVSNQGRHAVA